MLNFLKKKRKTRPGILLYYDLLNTKAEAKQVWKSCSCEELRPAEIQPESVERYSEIPDREIVESQSRDKAKARIEKLILEIRDLMTVDELNHKRRHIKTELPEGNANSVKNDRLSVNHEGEHSFVERDKNMKNDDVQPPLDIKELRSIASMAKKLNANSKK